MTSAVPAPVSAWPVPPSPTTAEPPSLAMLSVADFAPGDAGAKVTDAVVEAPPASVVAPGAPAENCRGVGAGDGQRRQRHAERVGVRDGDRLGRRAADDDAAERDRRRRRRQRRRDAGGDVGEPARQQLIAAVERRDVELADERGHREGAGRRRRAVDVGVAVDAQHEVAVPSLTVTLPLAFAAGKGARHDVQVVDGDQLRLRRLHRRRRRRAARA